MPGLPADHRKSVQVPGGRTIARLFQQSIANPPTLRSATGAPAGPPKQQQASTSTSAASTTSGSQAVPSAATPVTSSGAEGGDGTLVSPSVDGPLAVQMKGLTASLFDLVEEMFVENAELRKLVNHYSEGISITVVIACIYLSSVVLLSVILRSLGS